MLFTHLLTEAPLMMLKSLVKNTFPIHIAGTFASKLVKTAVVMVFSSNIHENRFRSIDS
jgi:hypothetical protein